MQFLSVLLLMIFNVAEAQETSPRGRAIEALEAMVRSNHEFVRRTNKEHFKKFFFHQPPRMTFVGYSDSRVHTNSFSYRPENNIFVIRTIGNPLQTAKGSIKYGVLLSNLPGGTPLFLIARHDNCGAIKDASQLPKKGHKIDPDV